MLSRECQTSQEQGHSLNWANVTRKLADKEEHGECKLPARGEMMRSREGEGRKQMRSRGKKERRERIYELMRLARRIREGLKRKLANCKQDCLAMLESRAKRITRRGPEKGEAKKKGRKTTATTRTDNGSKQEKFSVSTKQGEEFTKMFEETWHRCREGGGFTREQKQHKAVVRKEGFAHDGGPGSGQDWELSTRERRESWIFMWRRGIEEREKHVLARKAHSDVEVAKKW